MMINTNYVNCSWQEQSLQTDTPIIFSKYVENFIEVNQFHFWTFNYNPHKSL